MSVIRSGLLALGGLALLLAATGPLPVTAQAPLSPLPNLPTYAARIGANTGDEVVRGVAVDNTGATYVVGDFKSGVIQLGSGTNIVRLANAGGTLGTADAFVAKYSPRGVLEWAQAFGGRKDERGGDIAVDPRDNSVYVGISYKSLSFTVGSNAIEFEMPDGAPIMMDLSNILLIKLSSSGTIQWTAMYGEGTANTVGIDPRLGYVYVGGDMTVLADSLLTSAVTDDDDDVPMSGGIGAAYYDDDDDGSLAALLGDDDGSMGAIGKVAKTNKDIYLAAFKADTGLSLGANLVSGDEDDDLHDLAVDSASGSIYVVGTFKSMELSLDMDDTLVNWSGIGLGYAANSTGPTPYGYVAKIVSESGDLIWGVSLEDTRTGVPLHVAVDAANPLAHVYVSGVFASKYMRGIAGIAATSSVDHPTLLRLDAATGRVLWAAAGLPSPVALAFDFLGFLYVTGTFTGSLLLPRDGSGGGGGGSLTLTAVSAQADTYLVRLDPAAQRPNGTLSFVAFARSYTGGAASGAYRVTDLAVDGAASVYLSGIYIGSTLAINDVSLANAGTSFTDGFVGRVLVQGAAYTRRPTRAPTQSTQMQRPTPEPTTAPSITSAVPFQVMADTATTTTTMMTTMNATQEPSKSPTQQAAAAINTGAPTLEPATARPTNRPATAPPSQAPSQRPSAAATGAPTTAPTTAPSTQSPTRAPSTRPPSLAPSTLQPSLAPTAGATTAAPATTVMAAENAAPASGAGDAAGAGVGAVPNPNVPEHQVVSEVVTGAPTTPPTSQPTPAPSLPASASKTETIETESEKSYDTFIDKGAVGAAVASPPAPAPAKAPTVARPDTAATAATTTTTAAPAEGKSGSLMIVAIGAGGGGIFVTLLLGGIAWLCCRRRRKSSSQQHGETGAIKAAADQVAAALDQKLPASASTPQTSPLSGREGRAQQPVERARDEEEGGARGSVVKHVAPTVTMSTTAAEWEPSRQTQTQTQMVTQTVGSLAFESQELASVPSDTASMWSPPPHQLGLSQQSDATDGTFETAHSQMTGTGASDQQQSPPLPSPPQTTGAPARPQYEPQYSLESVGLSLSPSKLGRTDDSIDRRPPHQQQQQQQQHVAHSRPPPSQHQQRASPLRPGAASPHVIAIRLPTANAGAGSPAASSAAAATDHHDALLRAQQAAAAAVGPALDAVHKPPSSAIDLWAASPPVHARQPHPAPMVAGPPRLQKGGILLLSPSPLPAWVVKRAQMEEPTVMTDEDNAAFLRQQQQQLGGLPLPSPGMSTAPITPGPAVVPREPASEAVESPLPRSRPASPTPSVGGGGGTSSPIPRYFVQLSDKSPAPSPSTGQDHHQQQQQQQQQSHEEHGAASPTPTPSSSHAQRVPRYLQPTSASAKRAEMPATPPSSTEVAASPTSQPSPALRSTEGQSPEAASPSPPAPASRRAASPPPSSSPSASASASASSPVSSSPAAAAASPSPHVPRYLQPTAAVSAKRGAGPAAPSPSEAATTPLGPASASSPAPGVPRSAPPQQQVAPSPSGAADGGDVHVAARPRVTSPASTAASSWPATAASSSPHVPRYLQPTAAVSAKRAPEEPSPAMAGHARGTAASPVPPARVGERVTPLNAEAGHRPRSPLPPASSSSAEQPQRRTPSPKPFK